jgi:hypothetical protein
LLLTAPEWETPLWWMMVITGVTAALLSIATNCLDRRKSAWPTTKQRFLMHLASYGFLTVSILAFVLRGLLAPA